MTVVQSRIGNVDGTPSTGWVLITLRGPGLQPGSSSSDFVPVQLRVDGDGSWSRDLTPNALADHYVITEYADAGATRSWLIFVPDSDEPQPLSSLVVTPPLPPGVDGHIWQGPQGLAGPAGAPGEMDAATFAAAVADEMGDGTPARTVLDGEYEPRASRATAADGQVLTYQADGSTAWENPTGGGGGSGTVTSVNGQVPDGTGDVVITATDLSDLAPIATSGDVADLTGYTPLVVSETQPAAPATGFLVWVNPA